MSHVFICTCILSCVYMRPHTAQYTRTRVDVLVCVIYEIYYYDMVVDIERSIYPIGFKLLWVILCTFKAS